MESHCGGVDLVEDRGIISPYKGQRYQYLLILVEQIPQTGDSWKKCPYRRKFFGGGYKQPILRKTFTGTLVYLIPQIGSSGKETYRQKKLILLGTNLLLYKDLVILASRYHRQDV
jgi:hypothetical protein